MLENLRQRLTYANVMSTVAVFVALGGSSYAALKIDSGDIANNSVRGVDVRNRTLSERDVKRNTLGGRSIKESRLGKVPRASRRRPPRRPRRQGSSFSAVPSGTFPIADVCVETTARAAAAYGTAVNQCASTGAPAGPGKTVADARRAAGGAVCRPARSRRRADVGGCSIEHDRGEPGRPVRHRPGRQRGRDAQHLRWRKGIPLRRGPLELNMQDHIDTEGARCRR